MPIYEYRCQRCGHVLEVMQKVSDPAPSTCPQCGVAEPLERLVSRTSFQLKGGGWYSDLYGSVKKDGKAEGGAAAAAKPAGDAGTGATPAKAPAPATGGGTSSAGTGGASSGSGGSSGSGSSGGSGSGSGGGSGTGGGAA